MIDRCQFHSMSSSMRRAEWSGMRLRKCEEVLPAFPVPCCTKTEPGLAIKRAVEIVDHARVSPLSGPQGIRKRKRPPKSDSAIARVAVDASGPKRFVVVGRHGPLTPEQARMRAREFWEPWLSGGIRPPSAPRRAPP